MIKQNIFRLFILYSIISCTKSIDKLEKTEIAYEELPINVKKRFFAPNRGMHYWLENSNDYNEYDDFYKDLNTPSKYQYYSNQQKIFPWIYDGYIENIITKKRYLIGFNKSVNYIIWGDSLYIPNNYNLYAKDSLTYTFTRYILK